MPICGCASCGTRQAVSIPERINVKDNPELKAGVKDGSLFVWTCPNCGTQNLVSAGPLLYHDPDSRLMVYLLPPGSVPPEMEKALESRSADIADALEDYTLRRVDDAGTLLEKVNIFDAGLDDCVMEICKHVTKLEMAQNGDKSALDAAMKFFRLEGPDNELIFSYPKDGSMQCVGVGFNVYEDCAAILRRNPSVRPAGGFPKVDSDWVDSFFR
ncbi:MAG: CpXC domain-containing protein [Candidatus Cryptobacteroides sp.]